jgi:hypothetical protein
MKRNSLFLFFFILSIKIFSFQNNNKEVSYDSIYKLVIFNGKQKQNTKALFYSRRMLEKALKNSNDAQEAKAYYKIAEFQRKLNYKDSAFYFYNKSKQLYLQQNDSLQLGRSLLNIAILESDFGSFSNSDSTAVLALKYLKGRRRKTIISIYNCLAINSKKQHLYNEAIYNYKKTLALKPSGRQQIAIKNNIANVYKELKNYSKTISILEDLLKNPVTNQKTKARIIDNLAHTKWLSKTKEAVLNDFILAKSIRTEEKDNYGLIASYSHLSDFYYKKDNSKSLFYANKMYKVAKKQKATNGLLESIDKIVTLQSAQKSIAYYKESIYLRDSLKEVETKKQFKFAKIKYNYEEEEKKKLKFETLAAENKLIAEQENSQKKNSIIVGVVFVSGLLLLIYRRKQQHKKRILLEKYNTEISIAKKLHDELGNGIYNVIAKVQSSNYKADEIISDLDKVYLQTRKISHENDVIPTGVKFENCFRELVSSYNSETCKIILKDLSSLDLNSLNADKQIVLYRVFNELFVNMKKHSKASLVVLTCNKTNKLIEMTYSDNGVGFKGGTIALNNGLINMETRIKTIDGSINFENKPSKGIKVAIHFKK